MADRATIRPHEKLKAKYRINTLLIFFLLVFPFVLLGLIPELGWWYVVIFMAANMLWLIPVLILISAYYHSLEYELLEDEVVVHKGIITKTVGTVPYNMITNIAIKRGPVDRLLDLGGLELHTAGYSGQNSGPEARLVGLMDYEELQQRIRAAAREHRPGTPRPGTEAAEGLEETSAKDLLARILEELQALRESLDGQA
jgi:hypothetical protein